MLGLMDGVGNKLPGVTIGEPVVNLRALLPGGNHAGQAHFGQMLGHGSRGLSGFLGQRIHRQLAITKGKDQPDPGGVRQHGENLDCQLHILAVGPKRARLRICIHTQIVA